MKYESPEDKSKRVSGMVDKLQDAPKGKLRHISVDAADNGYSVHVHRDLPPAPAPEQAEGDGSDQATASASMADKGSSNTVFQKKKDVLSHIQKHLGE